MLVAVVPVVAVASETVQQAVARADSPSSLAARLLVGADSALAAAAKLLAGADSTLAAVAIDLAAVE